MIDKNYQSLSSSANQSATSLTQSLVNSLNQQVINSLTNDTKVTNAVKSSAISQAQVNNSQYGQSLYQSLISQADTQLISQVSSQKAHVQSVTNAFMQSMTSMANSAQTTLVSSAQATVNDKLGNYPESIAQALSSVADQLNGSQGSMTQSLSQTLSTFSLSNIEAMTVGDIDSYVNMLNQSLAQLPTSSASSSSSSSSSSMTAPASNSTTPSSSSNVASSTATTKHDAYTDAILDSLNYSMTTLVTGFSVVSNSSSVATSSSSISMTTSSSATTNSSSATTKSSQASFEAVNQYYYPTKLLTGHTNPKVKPVKLISIQTNQLVKMVAKRKLSDGQTQFKLKRDGVVFYMTLPQFDFKRAYLNQKAIGQTYRLTHDVYEYSHYRFYLGKRSQVWRKGATLKVTKLIDNHGIVRIQLSNGHYLTANRHFLKRVTN